MKRSFLIYAGTLGAFMAVDAVWLTQVAPKLYMPLIGHLLADEVLLAPAVFFYLIYGLGIVVFAVFPGLQDGRMVTSLWKGALFGFVAYATYDLTNHATLKGWPLLITVLDMVWGAFVTGVASVAGYAIGMWLQQLR